MDPSTFGWGILQGLVAHWIILVGAPLVAGALAFWGRAKALWSWPTTIIMAIFAFGSILWVYNNLPLSSSTDHFDKESWFSYKYQIITDKTFRNERIVLDGKKFTSCIFENVTFEYNGTAPFGLTHNTINGSYFLDTNNLAIENLLAFLKEFNYLKDEVKILSRR